MKITSIEAIHVVNKKYFGEDERVMGAKGKPESMAGQLKECDLKITFSLPYNVTKNVLSSAYHKCTTPFTEAIEMKIGSLVEANQMEPRIQQPQRFAVLVPLLRGAVLKKPPLEYLNLSGHNFVHYTIEMPGAIWPSMEPFTWRIRIKVSQCEDKIECVSVSSAAVDLPRLRESVDDIRTWLGKFWPQRVMRLLKSTEERPLYQSATITSEQAPFADRTASTVYVTPS